MCFTYQNTRYGRKVFLPVAVYLDRTIPPLTIPLPTRDGIGFWGVRDWTHSWHVKGGSDLVLRIWDNVESDQQVPYGSLTVENEVGFINVTSSIVYIPMPVSKN